MISERNMLYIEIHRELNCAALVKIAGGNNAVWIIIKAGNRAKPYA
jgi:hypothetical protein